MEREHDFREADILVEPGQAPVAGVSDECCPRDVTIRPGAWRFAWATMVVGAVALALLPVNAHRLFANTQVPMNNLPQDSPAVKAAAELEAIFPHQLAHPILMAVQVTDGASTVLTEDVERFSLNISSRVKTDPRVSPFKAMVGGFYTDILGHHLPRKLSDSVFVSEDRKTTLMIMQATASGGKTAHSWYLWRDVTSFIGDFCRSPPPGTAVIATSLLQLVWGGGCSTSSVVEAKGTGSIEMLLRAELCTIPVAMMIIAYLVRGWRLLVLPPIVLAVAFSISSGVVGQLALSVIVPPDVPPAMASVSVALCLDYSLFMLARFSEQHAEGFPIQRNVDTVMRCTGHTILVSGTLIAIAFFGALVLPEENLRGAGLCMGIATLCCMVSSVVLLPSLLLVGGHVLTASVHELAGLRAVSLDDDTDGNTSRAAPSTTRNMSREGSGEESQSPERGNPAITNGNLVMLSGVTNGSPDRGRKHLPEDAMSERTAATDVSHDQPGKPLQGGLWKNEEDEGSSKTDYGIVGLVDRAPVGAIFVVLLLMLPFFSMLPRLHLSADTFALRAMDTHSVRALREINRDFPVGIIDPYMVVITAPTRQPDFAIEAQQLAAGLGIGLTPEAMKSIGAQVAEADFDLDQGQLVSSMVAASASAGASKAGGDDAETLRAATRAAAHTAHGAGGSAEDVARGVGAVAAGLQQGGHLPPRAGAVVEQECLQNGYSESQSAMIAASVERRAAGADQAPAENVATVSAIAAAAAAADARAEGKHAAEVAQAAYAAAARSAPRASTTDLARASGLALAVSQEGAEEKGAGVASRDAVQAMARSQGHSPMAAAMLGAAAAEYMRVALERLEGSEASRHVSRRLEENPLRLPVSVSKLLQQLSTPDGASEAKGLIEAAMELNALGNGTLLTPVGFAATLDLCQHLAHLEGTSTLLGAMWLMRKPIDYKTALLLSLNTTKGPTPLQKAYRGLMLNEYVKGNRALLQVHTTFPSTGAGSGEFVIKARKLVAEWSQRHPGFTASIAGGASEFVDTREAVMGSLWIYLAVSVTLIVLVVFFAFGSVVLAVRLLVALLFTLAATYGAAVIIYQTPLFHWKWPWLADFNGLTYQVVPIATCLAVALGLDYDIFLVSRIIEFRMRGYPDRASVLQGTMKTSGIISGAGLIMACAFSGLCFSNKLLLQQFGVLLIISVLFDTYVVRTVLVPALMISAQGANWWPRRMPPETCGLEDSSRRENDEIDRDVENADWKFFNRAGLKEQERSDQMFSPRTRLPPL